MTSRDERQLLGVQKWINNKCKGTWMYCTGFGKTKTAIIAINRFLAKNKGIIKIIVPTEYLKLQWLQELGKNNLLNYCSVEIINTAVKEYFTVDFLIIDEVHRVAADTFYDIFKKSTPKMVLGLSATFERLDGKHELLEKYCPVCDIVTIKEAIANKWLSPYKEYKVLIEVDDIEQYKEANASFISSFSFFSFDFKVAMNCLTNIVYRRHYGKTMGASANEVDAQIFTWNRALKFRKQFVMNHPKKLEITRKILEARQDKKAITFSATIAQAEKIGNGFLIHSGNTKKKNRVSLEDFNDLIS